MPAGAGLQSCKDDGVPDETSSMCVLGTVGITSNGEQVVIGGEKPRRLLAMLVLGGCARAGSAIDDGINSGSPDASGLPDTGSMPDTPPPPPDAYEGGVFGRYRALVGSASEGATLSPRTASPAAR